MSLPFDISEKLKSVQVRHYVEWLGRDSHCGYGFAFGYDEKSYRLIDELFQMLQDVETNDFYRFCALGYAANNYDGQAFAPKAQYPMMSWLHMTRCYMVFGHIHGNTDADYWPLIRENDLMLNAGADVNGFAPVTFEEMQENNYRHKAGWNPELCTMEADQ